MDTPYQTQEDYFELPLLYTDDSSVFQSPAQQENDIYQMDAQMDSKTFDRLIDTDTFFVDSNEVVGDMSSQTSFPVLFNNLQPVDGDDENPGHTNDMIDDGTIYFNEEEEVAQETSSKPLKKGRKRARVSKSDDDNSEGYHPLSLTQRHLQLPPSSVSSPAPPSPSLLKPSNTRLRTEKEDVNTTVSSAASAKQDSKPPSLNFTRDELLVMTSEDFEGRISRLSALRPLTASEKNTIKRQRRLIKNRESAQASRQRKKDYVDDLESKVESLVSSNARLKEDFASLTSENAQLNNEVEFLNQLVRRIKVY